MVGEAFADISAAALTPPSERAQAKRFAKILRRELTEMNEKLVAAEVEWHLRCESEGEGEPPQRLVAARERVAELERMLKALRTRFPRIAH
ncbi:hypothetical protein [Mycobacterium sp.]|uniref:hypothetical protein n=1 Tax=Mycobacterium sp. TaxID=1785 RepID=UPI002C9472CC|nr:hypothetical protein [Mycobacterium sp.]HTQ21338.1 hypothetical protein [Mycobacterium sp.]